jgi:hypothetical protein
MIGKMHGTFHVGISSQEYNLFNHRRIEVATLKSLNNNMIDLY